MTASAPGFAIAHDEVRVRCGSLDQPDWRIGRYSRILSPDERQRADRYQFETDRRHFIAARAFLRMLLGRYLEVAPDQITFRVSVNGKPELTAVPGGTDLRFSYSHSRGLALCAVTRERRVGVDLEARRPLHDVEEIARLCLSPRENVALSSVHPDCRELAFLHCWTRKEAYLKATGEGLTLPPERVEVSIIPDEPAALLAVNGDPGAASRWSLRPLCSGPDYVATLAVEGHRYRLTTDPKPLL